MMIKTKTLNLLKFIIPVSCLALLLLSHFSALGRWLTPSDAIIFMLCGLTCVTGLEQLKAKKSSGPFLVGSSLILIAMRLITLIKL